MKKDKKAAPTAGTALFLSTHTNSYTTSLRMIVAFCPPNPNEFDNAV